LGDLGANGMGIPIGKLALYAACAGVHPHQCLPVMLDVGTNNEELLADPLYLGCRQRRVTGPAYLQLVDEFMAAVQDKYPRVLVQFEDFLTPNAYRLLTRYRDRALCFNDDIQGTAAVALAGVLTSTHLSGHDFANLRILFLGAGSAATGIADLMVAALKEAGLSKQDAKRRLWFVDVNGLVVAQRDNLMPHNRPYAHECQPMGFAEAVKAIEPHVLIGATGAPGTFTREIIESMAAGNERPVIFALSNPTSRAECTAQQAYEWSDGRALFASGSPFEPVRWNGRLFRPSQSNNAYVFPGMGLGAIACDAHRITDHMFLAAARTLAEMVTDEELAAGALYPSLTNIRSVSLRIAAAVAREAYDAGLARGPQPDEISGHIAAQMYDPSY
jgi:malate dehydrogenase (oxaloacetate-decarboxylating)(NADP+)